MEPNQKKRKLDISQFVDDEASVAGGRKGDGGGDDDRMEEDFLDDDVEFEDGSKQEAIEAKRIYESKLREDTFSRSANFIEQLQNRYVNDGNRQDEIELDEDDSFFDASGNRIRKHSKTRAFQEREKTYLVPTMSDPKLFLVKVKSGKEREIVLTLLQKYFNLQKKPKERLLFLSAFSIDSLSGYIYVEAFKESHVIQALQGIDDIFLRRKCKLVPVEQMIQVVDFTPVGVKVKKGSWVRVSRGLYKGDLAFVFAVNETRGEAMVKLIPRLQPKQGSGLNKTLSKVPDQKKFNKNDFSDREISTKNDPHLGIKFTLYDSKRFFEGFLYKIVNFKSIVSKNVNPTLDEIKMFGDLENVGELVKMKQKFFTNDIVKVMEGELKNLVGVIFSINDNDNNCVIVPKHETLKNNITISLNSIEKYLEIGDYVKVTTGKYEGEIGSIVHVKENTVLLYSEIKVQEFEVFISDIEKTSVLTVNKSYKGYSLHDLVKLDSQTWGVIVSVSNNIFKIKTNLNVVRTVRYEELMGKRNETTLTNRDRNNNLISLNVRVNVVNGLYKGRIGVVKHTFRNKLFLYSREILDDSGIFVVDDKHVETQGVAQTTKHSMTGGRSSFIVRRKKRSHQKVNQTIKVTKGRYKGLIGIVKSVIGEKARVELHSKFKTVSIPLKDTKTIIQQKPGPASSYYGGSSRMNTPWTSRPFTTPVNIRPTTPAHPLTSSIDTPKEGWNIDLSLSPERKSEDEDEDEDEDESQDTYSTNPTTIGMPNIPINPFQNPQINPMNVGTPGGQNIINTPSQSITTMNVQTPGQNINTPSQAITTPGNINIPGPVSTNYTPMINTPVPVLPPTPGTQALHSVNVSQYQQYPQQQQQQQQQIPIEKKKIDDHWAKKNMIVHVGGQYNYLARVITVQDGMATVEKKEDGKKEDVLAKLLGTTSPEKNDTVMIKDGEHQGQIGKVFGIDDDECIVQLKQRTVPLMIKNTDLTVYEETEDK